MEAAGGRSRLFLFRQVSSTLTASQFVPHAVAGPLQQYVTVEVV